MRYFFEITYHGKEYSGWQTQHNAVGVQQVVEDGLSRILGRTVRITGSGRTDAGVHCMQQFFHADFPDVIEVSRLQQRLNSFLPRDIAIRSIQKVKEDADARRDAIRRTYEYRVTLVKEPLLNGLALHFYKALDVERMNRAAALLLGEHDFQSFSKVKTDVNHFICTVFEAEWKPYGHQLVFVISANRFLRGMVRAIVGTLLDVGTEDTTLDEFRRIVRSRDRRRAGANVAPYGLYLKKVKYPRSLFIR